MGKIKRIWNIISGILVIIFAIALMAIPDVAFKIIAFILAFLLFVRGFGYLVYYLRMAQHMVGGKYILFYGVFMLDFGVFTVSISDEAKAIIIVYLIAGHLIGGAIDIVRSVRNRKDGYPVWKLDLAQGIVNLLIAIICLIFMKNMEVLAYIYCGGLIYLSIIRIISSFRKTAIVYIQ